MEKDKKNNEGVQNISSHEASKKSLLQVIRDLPREVKLAVVGTSFLLNNALTSCTSSSTPKETLQLTAQNDIGTYTESIDQFIIAQGDDMLEEKKMYAKAFHYFSLAKKEMSKYALYTKENTSFSRFIPLLVKETHLQSDATSSTGAAGYFQLKSIAIDEVNSFLKSHNIDTKQYTPTKNPADNMFYGMIYFLLVTDDFRSSYPDIQDVDDFVYASYNAGYTKVSNLIAKSGAESWDDLVQYVVHDLMGLSGRGALVDSPYGVRVTNFFGKKDYSGDKTKIFSHKNTMLTKSKAQEFIRYVETIRAMNNALVKEKKSLTPEFTISLDPGQTLFSTVHKMKKDGTLRLKDGINIADFCNDLAIDNNIDPANIPHASSFVVTKELLSSFDYYDENPYTHTVVSYDKANAYFLEKIVKDKLQDKSFLDDIVDNVDQLSSLEDMDDRTFYLTNSIIAYNTQHRLGWSTTTSKDVWIPSTPEYYTSYFQERKKEVETFDEKELPDISSNYVTTSLDHIGNELTYQGNFAIKDISSFQPNIIPVVGDWQTKNRDVLVPSSIILHSTAALVSKNIPATKAHFVVTKTGRIYGLTDAQGVLRQINHAGKGITGSGAIWRGHSDISYTSIGIEVEALTGEERNQQQYLAIRRLISYLGWKYHITKSNVLAHSQVAFSSVGRGRKQDPYYVNRATLGLPNNYALIDKDVAGGKSPNMLQFVKELQNMGMTDKKISLYLQGVDAGITIADTRKVKKMGAQDKSSWKHVSQVLK